MPSIFVTRAIPESGIKLLRAKKYDVDVSQKDGVLTTDELVEALKKKPYDAVLSLLTDKITPAVFDAAPKAKIFANYAVGFDNIDLKEAKRRGIMISNTPGVLTDTVAEHAFSLILAVAHRIAEADRFTRKGYYHGWEPLLLLGTDVAKKTLGVVGLGRIGSRLSHFAKKGFDMNIVYYDVARNEAFEKEYGATYYASVDELLPVADFVSIHVPLLPSTKHLIDAKRLGMMKKTAILVNTARGPVIDEAALVEALRKGTIRGAGLDVFEAEPALAPGLAELPNVILTPHIASATEETRSAMSTLAAENIIAALEGGVPANLLK